MAVIDALDYAQTVLADRMDPGGNHQRGAVALAPRSLITAVDDLMVFACLDRVTYNQVWV